MGASVSKNIANAVTKAIAKVSSDIIQNTNLSLDQEQIISITDVEGDVVIEGDKFYQKATINMKTLLDALSKEENQQKILLELAQEAKSLTSGLNLVQFSNAQDTMNMLLEATISMLSTISQTCSVFAKQYQTINISRVKHNVRIDNAVFNQIYDLLQSCSEKAISDNRTFQDVASRLDQRAAATSEGLSFAFIGIIALLVIGLPIIGGTAVGITVLKIIFPLLFATGCVLIAMYFYKTTEEVRLTGFSTLIQNNPLCYGVQQPNQTSPGQAQQLASAYPVALMPTPPFWSPWGLNLRGGPEGLRVRQRSAVPEGLLRNEPFRTPNSALDAAGACQKDPRCVAFDWKGMDVSTFGVGKPVSPPVTTFYSDVSSICKNNLRKDNTTLLSSPTATLGPRPPTLNGQAAAMGDIYLDVSTSHWYQRAADWPTGWKPMGTLSLQPFSAISWGSSNPTVVGIGHSPQENEVYVYFNESNPVYFHVFRYKNNTWLEERKVRGPGLIPSSPSIMNTSGFKETKRNTTFLYIGLALLVVGGAGTMYTFSKERYEGCTTYPFSFKDSGESKTP